MNIWQAIVNRHKITSYSDAISGAEQQDWCAPLQDHQLLIIRGPDAIPFLQGQCTCDFSRVKKNEWLLGAHCNAKGRMHSSFIAAPLAEDCIGLKVHSSIAESALLALKKYIVFSKADISISNRPLMGLYMTAKSHELPGNQLPLPAPGKLIMMEERATILRLDERRCEVWFANEQQLNAVGQNFFSSVSLTESKFWHWLNIKLGIAEINSPCMLEKLIPQELNYQLIDGISFNKGCYTGQEIIARMHYKAALKKHLYCCEITQTSGVTLQYEMAILNSEAKKVGMLIDCVTKSADHWQCLALVNDDAYDDDSLVLEQAGGAKLSWLPLTYAIPK